MRVHLTSLLLAAASFLAIGAASCGDHDEPPSEATCQLKPTETFHERIEPLLSDTRASTCNQCHLSGVDLSAFARDTPCKTWACLVDNDLVDVNAPEKSKILTWIDRASPDSALITPAVIAAEHDAFQDWITANAACPSACAGVACGAPGAGPKCDSGNDSGDAPPVPPSGDVTRGCSDVELEQAFYDDVYTWRGRCFPCHFDTEPNNKAAPRWLSAAGNCKTGSAVTLKRVVSLGLIDDESPDRSLLLLKPLGPDGGGVAHGGDSKFTADDPAYLSFKSFIEHYAQCQHP